LPSEELRTHLEATRDPRAAGSARRPGGAGGSGSPGGPGRPRPPGGGSGWLDALRRFAHRHGWRAYALPVLIVVTIAGVISLSDGSKGHRGSTGAGVTPAAETPAPKAGATTSGSSGPSVKLDPTNPDAEVLSADVLPAGGPYTAQGKGTYTVIPGTTPVVGSGTVYRYVIEAEDGISGTDINAFAAAVVKTLDDPRSWTGGPKRVALQRVAADAQADFRVALTTPMTLRPICGYDIKVETSCWDNQHGPSRVYLNLARWVRGDSSFGQDLATYRLYMVNHEVGHALGHVHTFTCLPNGLAPVMMQQTLTLKENQGQGPKTCQPNAWPYPAGVDPAVAVPT
jgi:hypothetical protein